VSFVRAAEAASPIAASPRDIGTETTERVGLVEEQAIEQPPQQAPVSAPRSLAERSSAAVGELARDLRAESFDLPSWDTRAASLARGLTTAACEGVSAQLARPDASLEEHIAAGELALRLEAMAERATLKLPPEVEVELLRVILDHESEPRLASAAVRPHAALGSAQARDMWIDVALRDDDPALAALAVRALGAVDAATLAGMLLDALPRASSDTTRGRLAVLLSRTARAGGTAACSPAALGAACTTLEALAGSSTADSSTRLRAGNALALLRGEPSRCARADGVLVAVADDADAARAQAEVSDLSRPAALRRRSVHLLGSRHPKFESELATALLTDPSAEVRSAAAAALSRGDLGPQAEAALQAASANDPALTVRRQAAQALAEHPSLARPDQGQ
jgi:hypothetical protein